MSRTGCLAVVVGWMAFAPSLAAAGVFGVEMGTPLRNLKVTGNLSWSGPVTAYDVIVPKPHPVFGIYTVSLAPQTGVCRIYAFSPNFSNRTRMTAAYKRVEADLIRTYGPPVDQDTRSARWVVDGKSGDDVMAVMLTKTEVDASTTALTIGYGFMNSVDCERLEAEADSAGL